MADQAQIEVTLPDGSVRSMDQGVTIRDVAASIGSKLAKAAIGGLIDDADTVIDVHTPLETSCALKIVTLKSPEGLEVLRHTVSHVLADAVQRLFPGTQVTIGPATDQGFYYDFVRDEGFTPADLKAIEKKMRQIVKANHPLEREVVTRDEARELFESMGESFKCEILDSIPEDDTITLYRHGEWVDLCRGPHVPRTGAIKAFKLTSVAGAYWRGDENNPMLARIYGTAFWSQEDLDLHLERIEEAKRRDHRKLGKELDLFSFNEMAPAMPFFHPKGTMVYELLKNFVRNYYQSLGFDEVITPQIVDSTLYKRSGHYANYKENMFFSNIDEREYGAKPMNCPGHTLIYSTQKRSYRDLPIRYADFGRLHRYERSGVTAGLTRVRSFCQDDAHIFCTADQVASEIGAQMAMIKDVYHHFGFETRIGFSTRPEKSLGREEGISDEERAEWDAIWSHAESTLEQAVKTEGVEYFVNAGDGAFYGPKLDFQVEDALGRWFQLGTIQLDFAMPRRFNLLYTTSENNTEHPVMVHRAVLGSLERFMGILIEHTGGDFPVWLAPTQLRLVTLNDDLIPYAEQLAESFTERGIRVAVDRRPEKLGFKIRDAELKKIPFVGVVGKKEAEEGGVSIRWRKQGDQGLLSLDQAISLVVNAATIPVPTEGLRRRVRRSYNL